jgi:hypothetical protein
MPRSASTMEAWRADLLWPVQIIRRLSEFAGVLLCERERCHATLDDPKGSLTGSFAYSV